MLIYQRTTSAFSASIRMMLVICLATLMVAVQAQSSIWNDYSEYPVYHGKDLGLTFSARGADFRIWSPKADSAELCLYDFPTGGVASKKVPMSRSVQGTWTVNLAKFPVQEYYAFRVHHPGGWSDEVPDPYVTITGVNGRRGQLADIATTNPAGWSADRPPFRGEAVDAVIYELHIRDASIAANSGIKSKGKYAGLAERGTRNTAGHSTGLDHLIEMGVTHVHLLPFFDFLSVDETRLSEPQYNWGYEPLNYNVPEGSYSLDPYKGEARIKELKQMIMTMHQNKLSVVMDVVYNHTMLTRDSYFNQLVPDYYYRQAADGSFSNATACGNETASERPMMQKFILESLEYWVREYHIDGFRFDLMGVHDIETMNLIAKRLRAINPHILLYGEGWTAGESPLPDSLRALKKNAARLDNIAVFSDDIRDGIKGSVFDVADKGFVSGKAGMEQSIRFGVTAACPHGQVEYAAVNYSKQPYAENPGQVVSYAECHDNHVLWDKLALSANINQQNGKKMHQLALAIVLTSQGIPFLHAGTEFLRSKAGNENSYNAGDSVNAINWDLKTINRSTVDYVKGLIQLRKIHPAFRLRTGKQVADHVRFLTTGKGIVAYELNGAAMNDSWKRIVVVYNSNDESAELTVPAGKWNIHRQGADEAEFNNSVLKVPGISCAILYEM